MKAAVVGSGGWGTALALVLLDNGHDVTLWSFSEEEAETLREKRENPLLKGVPLPERLECTSDISCVADKELVVFATPSFAVRETARKAAPHLRSGTLVVSVSKGIEKDTSLRLSQVIDEDTGHRCRIVALSGPSHAEEVGRHVPTGCVAASVEREAAEQVQDIFMNERFRIYSSPDIVGVELAAALKNVIALCYGVCDGLGYGDNTRALLMTRGLTETARLGVAMGGKKETFAGLAGVGDLIVTCTSMHSRNHRAGIMIGKGLSIEQTLKEVGGVVEGYYATDTVRTLARKYGIEMPISEGAYQVLYNGRAPKEVLRELMCRDKKHEIEDASW